MSGSHSPTVLSFGSVVVSTTGGLTGNILFNLAQTFDKFNGTGNVTQAHAGEASLPGPSTVSGPHILAIPADYNGSLAIPVGYDLVVYTGTGTLTGGEAKTAVVGLELNYSGGAGSAIGIQGSGTVNDTLNGAVLSFYSGAYTVTASGNNDTVNFDNGSNSDVTLTGGNDVVNLGSGSLTLTSGVTAAAAAVGNVNTIDLNASAGIETVNATAGSANLIFDTTSLMMNASGGADTVVLGPTGVMTLQATGGSQLIFDNTRGNNIIGAGTTTEFVSKGTGDVFSSSGGADTVFATSAIEYVGNNSAQLFFLGGAGAATVGAAGSETLFGGTGGGSYTYGNSAQFFGGGGSDTLTGKSALLAFGASNENLTIEQGSATVSNVFVSFGSNDTINASNTGGGNAFVVVNQVLPSTLGGTFSGNTTLVGSAQGNDSFTVFVDGSAPPAHTITISDWQASDTLFIGNLADAGEKLSSADSAAVAAFQAGGASTLTLSDGTTISFTDGKPTTIAHV